MNTPLCTKPVPLPPSPSPPQCLQKRGHDIALLSDEGSQLVACGRGERGGTLCWWDTLSPPGSGLVAELRGRKADPTALTVVHAPAGPLLVFGDEAGEECQGCGQGGVEAVASTWGRGTRPGVCVCAPSLPSTLQHYISTFLANYRASY